MTAPLDPQARDKALAGLSGWQLAPDGAAITRTFVFADFSEAFAFMTRAALAAEKLNHHPDWSNAWNQIIVSLTTHDAGGLTAKDIELAKLMDGFAGH